MKTNKVLLSGFVVALLASLLPLLVSALNLDGLGLDFSWLGDGDITLGELLAFIGMIFIGVSQPVRENITGFFAERKETY